MVVSYHHQNERETLQAHHNSLMHNFFCFGKVEKSGFGNHLIPPTYSIPIFTMNIPFDEKREDVTEFDRIFPVSSTSTKSESKSEDFTAREYDQLFPTESTGDNAHVSKTVESTPYHWYELERKKHDGILLPRVPSVVPTTTMKCASRYCESCRSSVSSEPCSVQFVNTHTRSLPLPHLKRRWWEGGNRDEGSSFFEGLQQQDSKRQKTTHKDNIPTPVHWALELQGWIDRQLNPLLDMLDDKREDTL
jgi:hypothetical protein